MLTTLLFLCCLNWWPHLIWLTLGSSSLGALGWDSWLNPGLVQVILNCQIFLCWFGWICLHLISPVLWGTTKIHPWFFVIFPLSAPSWVCPEETWHCISLLYSVTLNPGCHWIFWILTKINLRLWFLLPVFPLTLLRLTQVLYQT